MGVSIEALILYVVLFFSGSAGLFLGEAAEAADFSTAAEVIKIFLYCIPSLALIWYLVYKAGKIDYKIIKPGKKDLLPALITFPFLLITGFAIALVSSITGGITERIIPGSPSTVTGWITLCISCVCAACLEESFFRFYLLSRREEMHLTAVTALAVSTALFSVCHIYEGPWGFLNAVLSGAFLGFIFLRYNSLHGVAIAHSIYNISIYAINALLR